MAKSWSGNILWREFWAASELQRWERDGITTSATQRLNNFLGKDKNTFWERSNTKVNSAWVAGWVFLGTSRFSRAKFVQGFSLNFYTITPCALQIVENVKCESGDQRKECLREDLNVCSKEKWQSEQSGTRVWRTQSLDTFESELKPAGTNKPNWRNIKLLVLWNTWFEDGKRFKPFLQFEFELVIQLMTLYVLSASLAGGTLWYDGCQTERWLSRTLLASIYSYNIKLYVSDCVRLRLCQTKLINQSHLGVW